jgi:large subunit ribosomal protein L23
MFSPDFKQKPSRERESIAEQAQALLQGKQSWRTSSESNAWNEDGEEIEVETDFELPKTGA